jgi:hypothetical protein
VRAAEIVTRAPPVDTEIVIQLMMLPLTLSLSPALAHLQQSYLSLSALRNLMYKIVCVEHLYDCEKFNSTKKKSYHF